MANTTNYNWETPDDTDLVKDGAAAIRTLGSSVDTTTKALNPSTTLGDIEYRSATANTNTRLAIGTTGQVLTVAGGVPTWATSDDANAIQNAIVDAKGDLISATAADTPARLAVGTDTHVLTADSSTATGLKWAAPAGATSFPAFSAYLNTDTTPTTNVWTKIPIATEEFDTATNYDTSTYRFTPTTAGYYQINAAGYLYSTSAANIFLAIYKNGTIYKSVGFSSSSSSATGAQLSGGSLINFNGSSDYVEVYGRIGAGTATFSNGISDTYFNGVGIRA